MKTSKAYLTLHKAVRSAHRSVNGRTTKTRKGGILWRARMILSEPFRTKVEDGSGTACWSFKAGANHITFFAGVETMLCKVWKNPKALAHAIKQIYRHEIGHALYSPRGKKFFAEVKKEGLPFRLWNLFEDCRIEFKLWDDFKDLGLFYWHKYIETGKEITCPTNALLELKMRDSGARVSRSKTLKVERFFPAMDKIKFDLKGKNYAWHRKTICGFYSRAVCLLDSDHAGMIKLLNEWVKIYGAEVEGGSGFSEDAPFTEDEITGEPEDYEDGEPADDGRPVAEDTDKTDKVGSVGKDAAEVSEGLENFKVYPFVEPLDKVTSQRLFSQLLPIIKRARLSPDEIGRRGKLYLKRAMVGLADCFRSSVPSEGKRKIYLLIDMSGSMGADYRNGLGQIAASFAKLRDAGLVDLKVYLTKGNHAGKVRLANLSKAKPDAFLMLRPDGGSEMIKDALDKTKLDLIDADACFILTDGDIVDEPVEPNFWRSQGVDLVGVCVGSTEPDIRAKRYHMDKHFARSFISEAPSQLARRMLDYTMKKAAR